MTTLPPRHPPARTRLTSPEPAHGGHETLRQTLRDLLQQAVQLTETLEVESGAPGAAAETISQLEAQLTHAREELSDLTRMLVDGEHRAGRLAALYVATCQLHSTHDPAEVYSTIGEIVTDLLGGEQFALLVRTADENSWEVTLSRGMEHDEQWVPGSHYAGGDPLVDATLMDGLVRIGEIPEAPALAAIPILLEGAVVSIVVIFRLFEHRPPLGRHDRELIDAIAAHASSAFVTMGLVESMSRRLKDIESLAKPLQRLAGGGARGTES